MAGPELALREDWPRGVALRGADDMVALFCLSALLLRRIGNLCFVPLLQGEGGFVRRGNERTAKKDNKSVFRLEALLGTNSISLRYVNHQQQNGGRCMVASFDLPSSAFGPCLVRIETSRVLVYS
jgi:hypothetical protein